MYRVSYILKVIKSADSRLSADFNKSAEKVRKSQKKIVATKVRKSIRKKKKSIENQ